MPEMSSLKVVCQQCDGIVGVPPGRLGDGPRCPSCHAPLFAGHPVELSSGNFDRHIGRTDLPVVVDFWAPWCGPCRMMAPAFAEAAQRMEPSVRFAKLNTDQAQDVAGRFAIRSIPTMIVFKNGREVSRQSGALGTEQLTRWVTSAIQ
jgi:thioredoxin 2